MGNGKNKEDWVKEALCDLWHAADEHVPGGWGTRGESVKKKSKSQTGDRPG